MARQKITIEDRLEEFCCTASPEQIAGAIKMLTLALAIKIGNPGSEIRKRERKPKQTKEAPQAKPAGVE